MTSKPARYFTLMLLLLAQNFSLAGDDPNRAAIWKMYSEIKNRFADVPEMSLDDYKRLAAAKEKVVLVDVRELEERRISMLPGAISKDAFDKNREKYKDHKIVAYCTIGYRSGKFVRKLQKKNFDAYNLEGSFMGWVHMEGMVVDANGQPTKRLHVFGKPWNYPPAGYETTW